MNDRFPIAVFEWLGTFLALAAPTALVLRMRTRPIVFRSIFLFVCSVSPVIIYQGLMVSQYFYTVIGHMSISTMVLLAVVLLEHLSGKAFFHPNEQRFFFLSVVIGSALIFPQTFGIGPLNGYVLGFGSLPLTLALIVLTIAFVKFRMHVAACAVVLSVLAFDLHVLRSNNLWDYLLDPLLAIYATVTILRKSVSWATSRITAKPL